MPQPNAQTEQAAELPLDTASLLLRQIARRADRIVQETQRGPGLNLDCWLTAELELSGEIPRVGQNSFP